MKDRRRLELSDSYDPQGDNFAVGQTFALPQNPKILYSFHRSTQLLSVMSNSNQFI